ncbi:MAG: hypothetical protein Q8N51_11345, partial [Gammaproteobacteria bacterium]|nr:hypothetical protein [Gammaproteobacteria bacterium]
ELIRFTRILPSNIDPHISQPHPEKSPDFMGQSLLKTEGSILDGRQQGALLADHVRLAAPSSINQLGGDQLPTGVGFGHDLRCCRHRGPGTLAV